jgi:hypothetical protein
MEPKNVLIRNINRTISSERLPPGGCAEPGPDSGVMDRKSVLQYPSHMSHTSHTSHVYSVVRVPGILRQVPLPLFMALWHPVARHGSTE